MSDSPLYWRSLQPRGSKDYVHSAGFDGNQTDHITNWFIPREGDFPEGVFEADEDIIALLTEMTGMGHLSWVLFPSLLLTRSDQVILGL